MARKGSYNLDVRFPPSIKKKKAQMLIINNLNFFPTLENMWLNREVFRKYWIVEILTSENEAEVFINMSHPVYMARQRFRWARGHRERGIWKSEGLQNISLGRPSQTHLILRSMRQVFRNTLGSVVDIDFSCCHLAWCRHTPAPHTLFF